MMPYTRVGDIMVAMNPFQWIEGLYSRENQASYADVLIWKNADAERESTNSTRRCWDEHPRIILPSTMEDRSDSSVASQNNTVSSTKHQPMAPSWGA